VDLLWFDLHETLKKGTLSNFQLIMLFKGKVKENFSLCALWTRKAKNSGFKSVDCAED